MRGGRWGKGLGPCGGLEQGSPRGTPNGPLLQPALEEGSSKDQGQALPPYILAETLIPLPPWSLESAFWGDGQPACCSALPAASVTALWRGDRAKFQARSGLAESEANILSAECRGCPGPCHSSPVSTPLLSGTPP